MSFLRTQYWNNSCVFAAGELSLRVIDSMLGVLPKTWEFSGKTGTVPDAWQQVNLTLGARKHRFQVSCFLRSEKSYFSVDNNEKLLIIEQQRQLIT